MSIERYSFPFIMFTPDGCTVKSQNWVDVQTTHKVSVC